MQQYHDLLQHILEKGAWKEDRTGTGTWSCFGYQMRFDLQKGFPLLTTKKVFTKAIIHELLWFLQGSSNIQYLCRNGVTIWDDWPFAKYKKSKDYSGETLKEFSKKIAEDEGFAEKWGELGPVYGVQWRSWTGPNGETIDQITKLIEQINSNPNSRRLLVNAWNVALVDQMALPPCHTMFQFYVSNGKLSCQLYQRSADVFLGVPFNIASYALLTHMIAQVCNLQPGEFIHTFGDVHLYSNHKEQVMEQLSRDCRELPTLALNTNIQNIFDFTFADIKILNYHPHPPISGDVAV